MKIAAAFFLLPALLLSAVGMMAKTGKPSPDFHVAQVAITPPTSSPGPATQTVPLPKGVLVPVQLDAPVNWRSAAIGDEIQASLYEPINHKGRILFSKGARVEGRVVDLQTDGKSQWIELRFERIVDGNRSAPFLAGYLPRRWIDDRPLATSERFSVWETDSPGSVRISYDLGMLHLFKGYLINWVSEE